MKRQVSKVLAAVVLLACSSQASAILISASGGTNASETINDLTLGNWLTVSYEVTAGYAGDDGKNFPQFLVRLFDPCCNGLFQADADRPTGPISRTVDTSALASQVRDFRFTIDLIGDSTAFASVRILGILIDGQSIGVPEPAPLALLAIGLLGLVLVRRRRPG